MHDTKEVLGICDKATEGPWQIVEQGKWGRFVLDGNNNYALEMDYPENDNFVVVARTALPELAQRVIELEEENAKLQATIAATQDALEEIKARCELRRQDHDAHYENYYEAKKALAAAGYGGDE